MTDPGDLTIATYEQAAERYVGQTVHPPTSALLTLLDAVVAAVGPSGRVLELGSGPGHDANYLERHGLHVDRTDATAAFVDRLRAAGHDARFLDARPDELADSGGPYDAVLADAVLLHLTRPQFADVLRRARRAVTDSAVLALTLKEGDGEAWSSAKLDLPRFFVYWRAADVRVQLEAAGWRVQTIEHIAGRFEPWLYVVARATQLGSA